jgi:hypothetical protein
MDVFKLARDGRGNYKRDLGWENTGGKWQQHRFYLGKDRATAALRVTRLERLWNAIEADWNKTGREGERPSWTTTTLKVAAAIARGDEAVQIECEGLASFRDLLHLAGGCDVRVLPAATESITAELAVEEAKVSKAEEFFKPHQEQLEEQAEQGPQHGLGNQTLFQALDAYEAFLGRTKLLPDGSGRISPTGKLWQRQVRQIKAHAKDMPLGLFNLDAVEGMKDYWVSRPILGRTKKPASPDTVRDLVKRIRTFIKWLHKSSEFRWRKPEDYEPGRVHIRMTPAELSAKMNPNRVAVYSLEELGTLWEYGSPWERFLMVLALNCGFGADQLSMLQTAEIHEADERHLTAWIGRVRYKTGVYAEWTLWQETVAAIAWMKRRRADSKETAFVVTKNLKPLRLTKGSNRSMAIPNAWKILTGRVQKDHEGFRNLSFNKLRKTAIDLIRRLSDDETAGVFACHGQIVSDDLLEWYANRHFDKVFLAIDKLHKLLEPVFSKVADPFPADMKKHNPSVTLAQRKKIVAMRRQGFTLKGIAREVGLNRATVAFYLRKENLPA